MSRRQQVGAGGTGSGHEVAENGQAETSALLLSHAKRQQFGIDVATTGPGTLRLDVTLLGEVALNADQRAAIVPRIRGIVRQVYKKLGDISPKTLMDVISQIENGTAVYEKQDLSLVTKARKMKKADGYIDWSQDAEVIYNKIRGYWPWPWPDS